MELSPILHRSLGPGGLMRPTIPRLGVCRVARIAGANYMSRPTSLPRLRTGRRTAVFSALCAAAICSFHIGCEARAAVMGGRALPLSLESCAVRVVDHSLVTYRL